MLYSLAAPLASRNLDLRRFFILELSLFRCWQGHRQSWLSSAAFITKCSPWLWKQLVSSSLLSSERISSYHSRMRRMQSSQTRKSARTFGASIGNLKSSMTLPWLELCRTMSSPSRHLPHTSVAHLIHRKLRVPKSI